MTHPCRRRGGFTLVEILLAVTLATVLMAAVLAVLGGVGRDRKRLATDGQPTRPVAAMELLRWDLINATTITTTADGVVLRGHGGIDPASLTPNNRLTRVTYRVRRGGDSRNDGGASSLIREQRYLDDPVRPEPWADLVLRGVRGVAITPAGGGTTGAEKPARVSVTLLRDGGGAGGTVTEHLWVK